MTEQPAPGRRGVRARTGSVRARATLASVVVVGAAMAVGAVALISILHASMDEGVETTARAQMNDVASLLRLGQLPAQLPAGRDGTFTQVVASDGRVLATTASLLGTTPISRLHLGEDGISIDSIPTLSESSGHDSDPEGPYLLLAQSIPAPVNSPAGPGPITVYVASSLRPVIRATTLVGTSLAIGLPVLVILVGALVWIFTGRALRPVEAIRSEVADISGHDLHRRVPVPASADEVARLAETMNGMLDRLEASAAGQRRFVADASHELRSPLTVLQATLEVALDHPEGSAWPTVVADALGEARRLQRLVEDLLVLARMESGATNQDWKPVDLDDLILSETRRRRASGGHTRFDLHRVSGGQVHGDSDQLARVVHNLMDNAQRHATETVTVECSSNDGHVTLTVADDGPGVPMSERRHIFERFARIDEARTEDDGGSGLGLSIAKELVEAHGGTIQVTDSADGARFEIRLPSTER